MSLISKSTTLSASLLLLVAYFLDCDTAQARILLPNTVVTSLLNTTAGTEAMLLVPAAASEASILGDATKKSKLETAKQNPVNLEPATAVVVRQSSSVVQDWRLVCKELCGAGFGGGGGDGDVPCAAVCSTTKTAATEEQPSAVSRIASDKVMSRNANKLLICKDLCRLQLGNDACNCGQYAIELTPNKLDEVCQTFCVNGKVTLHGCSPCKLVENDMKFDHGTSKKLKESLRTLITTNTSSTTATNQETSTQNTSHGSRANTNDDNIKRITTDIIDIIDIEIRSSNGSTPDWNELCKSLCKTGDGGSLCKCDLSPFFS